MSYMVRGQLIPNVLKQMLHRKLSNPNQFEEQRMKLTLLILETQAKKGKTKTLRKIKTHVEANYRR